MTIKSDLQFPRHFRAEVSQTETLVAHAAVVPYHFSDCLFSVGKEVCIANAQDNYCPTCLHFHMYKVKKSRFRKREMEGYGIKIRLMSRITHFFAASFQI